MGSGHALVVGGTGMLRDVSLFLAARFDAVSVVARDKTRLASLVSAAPNVNPLSVDWRDTEALRAALARATAARGALDLAVCWIHSNAPEAPLVVAEFARCPYFQVFGSGGDAAQALKQRWRAQLTALPDVEYHVVVLGSAPGRWLTHDEIAAGVIRAVETGAGYAEVGTVS